MIRALLLLVVFAGSARADSVAYTCRAASNVKVTGKHGACVGFEARDEKDKVVSRGKGFFISGSILASSDGRSVVLLHHYPISDEKNFEKTDALVFYRDSKVVARYSMKDVIERMNLISASVSHYNWFEWPRANANNPLDDDADDFLTLGTKLVITTTSQRVHEFDVITGKRLSSEDTAIWKKCELFAWGDRNAKPVKGVYTIDKPRLYKGTLPGKLVFTVDKGVSVEGMSVLCFVADKQQFRAIDKLDVIWNM